jgi:hypothetical protein
VPSNPLQRKGDAWLGIHHPGLLLAAKGDPLAERDGNQMINPADIFPILAVSIYSLFRETVL